MTDVAVDLWGDLIDPWSYAAKRRVEAAIAGSRRPADVVLTHHALPGQPVTTHALAEAAIAARPDGIDISITQPPDVETYDAHRLVALGLALGGPALQGAVLERLYAAVFTQALDIGSPGVLQRLAAEAGLDEQRVGDLLGSSRLGEGVVTEAESARARGITATPYVVVDERLGLGGPASVEDYLHLIDGVDDGA